MKKELIKELKKGGLTLWKISEIFSVESPQEVNTALKDLIQEDKIEVVEDSIFPKFKIKK